jgi:hypothetical protein
MRVTHTRARAIRFKIVLRNLQDNGYDVSAFQYATYLISSAVVFYTNGQNKEEIVLATFPYFFAQTFMNSKAIASKFIQHWQSTWLLAWLQQHVLRLRDWPLGPRLEVPVWKLQQPFVCSPCCPVPMRAPSVSMTVNQL